MELPVPEYPPLWTIKNEHIVSLLESLIGDFIHGTSLYWDQQLQPVKVTKLNDLTLLVKVNLKADVPGFSPDADLEFHLNLDMKYDADSGTSTLAVTTSNFEKSVDLFFIEDILELGLGELVINRIEEKIENAWLPMTRSMSFNVAGLRIGVSVSEYGDIVFVIQSSE